MDKQVYNLCRATLTHKPNLVVSLNASVNIIAAGATDESRKCHEKTDIKIHRLTHRKYPSDKNIMKTNMKNLSLPGVNPIPPAQ